ncbi:hypothetical protein QGP82_01685 [Leptothoe sp. LEGE 181152]|nr:hypothetical protein [Leptothoe sp. LEGE 181152]
MSQLVHDDRMHRARQRARELLQESPTFRNMNRDEQMAMYKDMVQNQYNDLAEGNGGQLAAQRGLSTGLAASDQINDKRHLNERIGSETGDMASDFISDVDFPEFVEDLLTGVFDANLNVTVTQMQEYQQLLKSATKSLSHFVKNVSDEDAFGYLADNMGDQFSFMEDEQGEPTLGNASGQQLDLGDNQVKAKIMDAKLALAKEQRALLRETILMGISRLVVERGTVKAAVVFDVKATEKINKTDKAAQTTTTKTGGTHGGGLFGFIGRRSSRARKRSKISVSSAKSTATTDLAAQITGSVELVFKSDYFKLDNFASMYGGEVPQNQAGAQPQQPGQLPGG